MTIKDLASELARTLFSATPVGQVYNATQKSVPKIQQGIQNVAQSNPNIAGAMLPLEPAYQAAQRAVDKVLSSRVSIPTSKVTPYKSVNSLLDIGQQIALSPINAPISLLQASYKLPQSKNVREAAGYGAQAVNAVMAGTTPKGIQGALQSVTNQPKYLNSIQKIGSSILEGAKTGAQYGALGGAMAGVEGGINLPDPKEYAKNLIANVAGGTIGGGVVGGAVGGVGSVGRQTLEVIQGKARTLAKDQTAAIFSKSRKYWPQFAKDMGGDQQKIEDYLYKYYKTQLGQSGAANFSAKIGLPESAGQTKQGQSAKVGNADLPSNQVLPQINKEPEVSLKKDSSKKIVTQSKKLQAQETQLPQTQKQTVPIQGKKTPQLSLEEKAVLPSMQDNSLEKAYRKTLDASVSPADTGINVERMGITKESKDIVNKTYDDIKPQIEKVIGKKLRLQEVEQIARSTKESLSKVITREETERLGAQALNLRNKLAELSERGMADEEFIDTLIKDKAFGAHIARLLGQRRIVSNSEEGRLVNKIIAAVLKQNQNVDEILAAAKGVNFKDAKQATEFYRKFVSPKKREWVDLLRYNSMLSSPTTMINNAASNFLGTGLIAPIEKTITGGIDFLRSTVTGKPRKYLVGEGATYVAGYWSNVGNAAKKFINVMSGKSLSDMQELHNIPLSTSGPRKYIEGVLKIPTKILQATDEFFQTLTQAGAKSALQYKQSRGIAVDNVESQAFLEGRKRLFNAGSNLPEEGYMLKAIEYIPSVVLRAKSSSNPVVSLIAKYTFPFVKVPANIMKQSVEYSPLGLGTLWGAKNKEEQLSKAILGSSVGLTAAMLVATDRMTWAEPTSDKQKTAFRAAGMQPYAIKIGDSWYNYSKLHPSISFPLALVAATRNAEQNKSLDDGQVEVVLNGVSQWLNFFADQSYVKNIGDFVNAAKGDSSSVTRFISNYPQQLIPFRSLLGWVNRIVDPVQRKADPNGSSLEKQLQTIAMGIPGLSKNVPARLDSDGNEIKNSNPLLNAISPIKITTENSKFKAEYDQLKADAREKKIEQEFRDKLENSSDKSIESPNKIYYKDADGKIQSINKSDPIKPKLTGSTEVDKLNLESYATDISGKINDTLALTSIGKLTIQEAEKLIMQLEKERSEVRTKTTGKYQRPRTFQDILTAQKRAKINSEINSTTKQLDQGKITISQADESIKKLNTQLESLKKGSSGTKVKTIKISSPKKPKSIKISRKTSSAKKPKSIKISKAKKVGSFKIKKSKKIKVKLKSVV